MFRHSRPAALSKIAAASVVLLSLSIFIPAAVQAQESAFASLPTASVTYGPYLRFGLGYAKKSVSDGYWQPPGFPGDPQVSFDLNSDNSNFRSLAVGFDWQNGFRGDVSLSASGSTNVSGLCESASDGTPCATHANIADASVRTTALMANLFYAPLEQRGSNSVFQPFVVGGVGFARNRVGTWTRENATGTRLTRSFEGDTTTNLAWSVGFGASMQVTRPGKWPIIVEASWRYYDYGSAQGGSTPLPGDGSSEPVTPLSFDNSEQVISLGVRIPLKRF